jgi:hypothetical protein
MTRSQRDQLALQESGYHPAFEPPTDPDVCIWRYQDLAKLLNLLQRARLFFPRVDTLDDPFEGSYLCPTRISVLRRTATQVWSQQRSSYANGQSQFADGANGCTSICWHLNEGESAAMWDLYGRSGNAIAVRSTPRRLLDSVDWDRWWPPIVVGMVRYADYHSETIGEDYVFQPGMTKRRSFAHERELRAVTLIPNDAETHATFSSSITPTGVYVAVRLEVLVESILVAPRSPQWFVETVTQSVHDAGFTSVPVLQSHLDEDPLF